MKIVVGKHAPSIQRLRQVWSKMVCVHDSLAAFIHFMHLVITCVDTGILIFTTQYYTLIITDQRTCKGCLNTNASKLTESA